VSLLDTIINRIRGRKPADSPVVCAVGDDGSGPAVDPGELSPFRADPTTGAVRVTAVASTGSATPALVTPTDADANTAVSPAVSRAQFWDPIAEVWARAQASTNPALVLGDKRGLHTFVLGGEIVTTPAQQFLLTAPPALAEPATAVRVVRTGEIPIEETVGVTLPQGFYGNVTPASNARGVHVRTTGPTEAHLYAGGDPVSDTNPIVVMPPPYGRTSFGQTRVAQREVLFEDVQTYALDNVRTWSVRHVGGGSTSFSTLSGVTTVAVSGASGDVEEISTHTHFPYEPGATTHTVLTLKNSDAGQTNQIREWGFGTVDDADGFYFRLSGTTLYVVRRSSSSGVAVDADAIQRSSWNKDQLDGSGSSEKTLDLTMINQWEIDFQWLSAGVVRYWINGVLAHELDLRGAVDLPATRTGQLPLRITVKNTGASVAGSVGYVCSVVYRDGGTPTRFRPGSHTLTAPKTGIGTTFTPVIAFRLAQTYLGRPSRTIVIPRLAKVSNASGRGTVRLHLNPSAIAVTGNWTPVTSAPWLEYHETITSITGGQVMSEVFLPNSADARELDGEDAFALNGIHLRRTADNTSGDTIVLSAAAYLGNIDIVSLLVTFKTLGS
jgi:hypothetical protein